MNIEMALQFFILIYVVILVKKIFIVDFKLLFLSGRRVENDSNKCEILN